MGTFWRLGFTRLRVSCRLGFHSSLCATQLPSAQGSGFRETGELTDLGGVNVRSSPQDLELTNVRADLNPVTG
jgi:hypothetical protein